MKKNNHSQKSPQLSRRSVIKKTAAASAFTIVPAHILTGLGYTSPNDMVNIAAIGVGNRGGQVIQNIATPDAEIKRDIGMSGFLRQPYAGIKPERGSFRRQP